MEGLVYPWVAPVLNRLPVNVTMLPRALLLTGSAGLGKRACAFFLAQGILCETQRTQIQACGACASCLLFKAGNHPDLRILESAPDEDVENPAIETSGPAKKASRNIPVQRIRGLTEFITLTSHRGGAKVICILPAEAMLPASANALLKMLEEPQGETHFILISHEPDRLLPTIRSRCFQLAFTMPDPQPALNWLRSQGTEQAELALAQGSYAPLAAMELASDENFWSQRKLLLDLLAVPGFDPLRAADHAENIDGEILATLLSQWAYDIAALQSGNEVRYHADYASSLRKWSITIPAEQLMKWYDSVIQFGRVAQHPLNKRLAVESLLVGYPS